MTANEKRREIQSQTINKEIYDVLKLFASLNPTKTLEMERLSRAYI